jgi:hypothetical protein
MSEYVKITPNGHTLHIQSERVKKFGAVERPVTVCGLWIHPHSVIIEVTGDEPDLVCPVCKKRTAAASGGQ